MSEKTDRGIRSGLLLRVVIVICTVAVGAGIYLWWLMDASAPATLPKQGAPGQSSPVQPLRNEEPLNATIYYPADGLLATGFIAVKRQPDVQTQAREVISALSTDQRSSHSPLLRGLKVREFYLDASGTAYLDLASDQQKAVPASMGEELMAIYALVNTLMQNFEEIKQVCLLIDGKEAQTLAGHIDLSRKFTKRMDLVRQ
jgi:hypothetical protein